MTFFLRRFPAGPDAHQYLLLDRATGNGRLLLEPPRPEAARSGSSGTRWRERYGDELKRPVSITREDWPIIEAQWNQFFVIREARAREARARLHSELPQSKSLGETRAVDHRSIASRHFSGAGSCPGRRVVDRLHARNRRSIGGYTGIQGQCHRHHAGGIAGGVVRVALARISPILYAHKCCCISHLPLWSGCW